MEVHSGVRSDQQCGRHMLHSHLEVQALPDAFPVQS